eukprot:CAMPEP_0203880878 /NCGR_PEP_ID=MMETSP0359-20131031/25258_1 /ASSEMBLY_ACC=CAM_ASM_000338 /TAXON_ID=268821 /ORGANISM="Scrippsiella Hangoei, Strain SHTV-5" /LENGTH=81 /DNA_ID=CAMNT_0050800597 /DNA_START=36 /DNA_END=278 /DNA_ORIENTATION=+
MPEDPGLSSLDMDFTNDALDIEAQSYGVLYLLQYRAAMCSDLPKPAEVAHLKFLALGPTALPGDDGEGQALPKPTSLPPRG